MPVGKLSLLVPCFNEEENIDRYDSELFPFLDKIGVPIEYVFINDGSTDATAARLKNLQQHHADVRLVHHPENRGLGAAVRSGLKAASGDAVVTLDADLTFPAVDVSLLLDAYSPSVDCVMGSPILGHMEGVTPFRAFLSRAVNRIYQALWPVPLTATSSVFRLYRTSVLQSFDLESDSFNINAEILFKLMQKRARIVEVPVVLRQRVLGSSKIRFGREIKNHLIMFARIISWRFFRGIVKKDA